MGHPRRLCLCLCPHPAAVGAAAAVQRGAAAQATGQCSLRWGPLLGICILVPQHLCLPAPRHQAGSWAAVQGPLGQYRSRRRQSSHSSAGVQAASLAVQPVSKRRRGSTRRNLWHRCDTARPLGSTSPTPPALPRPSDLQTAHMRRGLPLATPRTLHVPRVTFLALMAPLLVLHMHIGTAVPSLWRTGAKWVGRWRPHAMLHISSNPTRNSTRLTTRLSTSSHRGVGNPVPGQERAAGRPQLAATQLHGSSGAATSSGSSSC